jgi:ArsR family transcriptional regulator, arsenate/arsenite/antimonite-responsive transcriptional repressor
MEKELIKILKALADENRIRILNLLNTKKLCVCEIEKVLNMNQSNVSRHLNKLKNADLIDSVKQAQFVCYKINEEIITKFPFLKTFLTQLPQIDRYKKDIILSTDVKCVLEK